MSSASNVSGRRFRSNAYFFTLMMTILCAPTSAQAQMFSVKPQRQSIELPAMVISVGLERMDVSRNQEVLPIIPASDFSFSADLLRLQLETGGLVASYTTGRGLGSDNTDYTSFELALASGFQFLSRGAVQLEIPFNIYSVNTTMTSRLAQINNAEFRQNALGLRTGLQTQVRFSPRSRMVAFGTGGYAFSANGFSSNGGNVIQWDVGVRLFADALIRSAGFTTGVFMQQRRYDLDNRFFNYDMNSVSILVGVTF